MRHLKEGRKFSRRRGSRVALLKNLVRSFFEHGKIKTTEAKAKEIKPMIDKLINSAKKGDLSSRRRIMAVLANEKLTKKVLELGAKYKEKNSGFSRIYKLGPRRGDSASLVILELV